MGETILLGMLLAIVFYELTDISPGGIIVPGMLAYYVYDPRRIILTVVVAVLASFLVRYLSKHVILFGRRKYVVHIVVAAAIGILLGSVIIPLDFAFMSVPLIGTIIAGILASEITKQGPVRTLLGLGVVLLVTSMVVWII
ncbi:MAG: poly-gamma-glutamate biosynthesis protein PgsC/CapC [Acholeplasmataceae bacterium]